MAIGIALLVGAGTTLYATDLVDLEGPEPAKLADGELAHAYGPKAEACQSLDYAAAEDFIAPLLGAPGEETEGGAMAAGSQMCTLRFFEDSTESFGQIILSAAFYEKESEAASFFDPEREISAEPAHLDGAWADATVGFDADGGTLVMNVLDGNLDLHLLLSFFHEASEEAATDIAVDLIGQLMNLTRGNAYDASPSPPEVSADDMGPYEAREDLCERVDWSEFDEFEFSADEGYDVDGFEPSDEDGYGAMRCGGGEYYAELLEDHAYVEFVATAHPAISMAADEHDSDVAELKERTAEDGETPGTWNAGTLGEGKAIGGSEDGIYLDLAVRHENLSVTVIFAYDGGGSPSEAREATVALAEQLIGLH